MEEIQDRLKVTIVGHVDHGKSTLIGRLLYDTGSVPQDRLDRVHRAAEQHGADSELAFLIDHLEEEREGEMTINTAQIFFETDHRKYVLIDAPGHREFLRNMLTGASQAHAAVLIVDAAEGMGPQTSRHAFLLSLLGIEHCLVAVNKMDLVGFSHQRFQEIQEAVRELLAKVKLDCLAYVPISAKHGDNVVTKSARIPWYRGETVLEVLAGIDPVEEEDLPTRFCVQDVYDFDGRRVVAGRMETGRLDAGDRVIALPDEVETEVYSIGRFLSRRTFAEPGECVGLILPDDFVARRGQVLCAPEALPRPVSSLTTRLIWMSDDPLTIGNGIDLRVVTQEATCSVAAIRRRLDSSTLDVLDEEATHMANTDVAHVDLTMDEPLVVELAAHNPSLGRLVLERQGEVVGAGVVVDLP